MNPLRTTSCNVVLREGSLLLEVHFLDADDELHEVEFDIDAYALELASTLLHMIVKQKHSEDI